MDEGLVSERHLKDSVCPRKIDFARVVSITYTTAPGFEQIEAWVEGVNEKATKKKILARTRTRLGIGLLGNYVVEEGALTGTTQMGTPRKITCGREAELAERKDYCYKLWVEDELKLAASPDSRIVV
ncbi:hypothetical protein H6P81_004142 [Aristolochia fimbriata]|uniref:Uncharacterized protein n=1 Tax=Aristolochia fimbriata TaxID=158543 RepID=A0AAV7FGB7_ARIFI|nr:hypothetical protein H6P81_004142 [Aristolochia fimbriata]